MIIIICCLCLLEIYMNIVWEILSAITNVHTQAGLLLACTMIRTPCSRSGNAARCDCYLINTCLRNI